jgi:hypothetical protein
MTPPLGDTLLQLLGAFDASVDGIVVTDAELTVPLEGAASVEDGVLVIRAGVPHTRWVSGFLPPVHRCVLRLELVEDSRG